MSDNRSPGLRISVYNEPQGSGIGGSEFLAALLAEALSRNHRVDLFHSITSLTAERLGENSGTDLTRVNLRYVSSENSPPRVANRNPSRHYKSSRQWLADLSKNYDVFIAIMHGVPPFCHATKGALIVLFPTPTAPYVKPTGGVELKSALKHPARFLYQSWEWKKRMQTYQLKTAISNFSGGWAKRRWGIDCQVVYPPVDTNFQRAQKEKMILSVGRFAIEGEGHGKKQEEMLAAFRRMKEEGLLEWRYFCVGALGGTDRHRAHFAKLSATVSDIGAELIANINRDRLKDIYEQAAIFWHAAGYGEDEDTRPIFLEHFGISTVEAMAAGCVPVVINKGGQREIVEHGVNGFLWETLEDLRAYTRLLMNDDRLRERMAEAARERAQKFSREAFVDQFLGQLVGSEGPQAAEQSHRAPH
jgi:glycosyltransferase involved in cell wall biosynthesis